MKVVDGGGKYGLDLIASEIRLGVTQYRDETFHSGAENGEGAGWDSSRTGCQPIGDRCSLHLPISSLRDSNRHAHATGCAKKLSAVLALIRLSLMVKTN